MPGPHDAVTPELAAERAVRAAARAGNRLLSGHRARVDIGDRDLRESLTAALTRMGVRVAGAAGEPSASAGAPEFVFTDAAPAGRRAPAWPEHSGSRALPTTVITVDGRADSGRAEDPAARIAWAARGMPVTARLADSLRALRAAQGDPATAPTPLRIAVSLVLEPKTAALALALADAGCEVAVFSAVSETDIEIARALAADSRVSVFAPTAPVSPDPGRVAALDAEHARAVLSWGAEILIDDGSHLIRLAHTEHPEALTGLRGAAEETTSGVRPLLEMVARGALRLPVIAVNDARTKTDFDNLIGTGQSCVFAIADCLEAAEGPGYRGQAGSRWTVVGYGPVGVGVARFAAALGASVTVVERDPVRALAALHDGFEARRAADALPGADVVVSATGVWHTLDAAALAAMRPGAAVAVAGGIDDEVALDQVRELGWTREVRSADVDEWIPPGAGRGVRVLANGGGVNYSAGEGNPIEVMDLSFATQLAAVSRLLRDDLPPGVHPMTRADEQRVALLALDARDGAAEAPEPAVRAGGAAQPWSVHRYRSRRAEPLDSSE